MQQFHNFQQMMLAYLSWEKKMDSTVNINLIRLNDCVTLTFDLKQLRSKLGQLLDRCFV